MKRLKKALFFLLALCLFSCASQGRVKEDESVPPPYVTPLPLSAAQEDHLTIIAVGDNLYHDVMIRSGEEGDYETVYQEISGLAKAADIAFINQETLLAGKDFGFSGYPQFNSPQKLGQAVTATGFNVVNHATNHIMDKGEKAVIATMDFWDAIPGVTVLGIHRSKEGRALPKLVKKNNITVGFLGFTYGTNGISVPSDKPHLVSLMDTEIMAEEIAAIRPLCDFLVVSMHWGEEYRHDYSENQKKLAAFLAEHRVDMVIGHHPHVIQPLEYITRPDGKPMLCFYSLGNLVSAQTRIPTLLGAMAFVKIKKAPAPDGDTTFTDLGVIPLVTHYEKNYTGFKVYPLYAYTEELAQKHRVNQEKKEMTVDYLKDLAAKILGSKVINRDLFRAYP